MGTYLKQSEVEGKKKNRESKKKARERPITTYERVCEMDRREPSNLGGIEDALESLANHVGRYVAAANSDGHNALAIFTGEEGAGNYPILIALDPCSETTENILKVADRIAKAFERIADAMTGRIDNAVTPDNPQSSGEQRANPGLGLGSEPGGGVKS